MPADLALLGLELAWLILAIVPFGALAWWLWTAYGRYHMARQELVVFELQSLAWRDAPPASTNQLLRSLHGLLEQRTHWERLTQTRPRLSLELIATQLDGVRYRVVTEADLAPTVRRLLVSYLPDGAVRQVALSYPKLSDRARVLTLSQRLHGAYPLGVASAAQDGDAMTYLASTLSHLEPTETMAVQLLLWPTRSRALSRLRERVVRHEDVRAQLNGSLWGEGLLAWLRRLLLGSLAVVDEVLFGKREGQAERQRVAEDTPAEATRRPARGLTPLEEAAMAAMSDKLHQPLFMIDYRVLIDTASESVLQDRTASLAAALALHDGPSGQGLVVHQSGHRVRQSQLLEQWWFRLPARWVEQSILVSVSEVTALYHAPHSQGAASEQTDDSRICSRVKRDFTHEFGNHSKLEYVKSGVHTNTIEGFWGQLKRSLDRTYHCVSPKYLQYYVNEFVYRYNHRHGAVFPSLLVAAAKRVR